MKLWSLFRSIDQECFHNWIDFLFASSWIDHYVVVLHTLQSSLCQRFIQIKPFHVYSPSECCKLCSWYPKKFNVNQNMQSRKTYIGRKQTIDLVAVSRWINATLTVNANFQAASIFSWSLPLKNWALKGNFQIRWMVQVCVIWSDSEAINFQR